MKLSELIVALANQLAERGDTEVLLAQPFDRAIVRAVWHPADVGVVIIEGGQRQIRGEERSMKLSELIIQVTGLLAQHSDAPVLVVFPVGSETHDREIVRVRWHPAVSVVKLLVDL